MVRIDRFLAAAVLTLAVSLPGRAAVPEALLGVLQANGCRDVSDDVRVRRFDDQWWVSLAAFTGNESDFALYCENDGDETLARLLLVIAGDRSPWSGCDDVVDVWRGNLPFRYVIRISPSVPERIQDLGGWWLVRPSGDPLVAFGAAGQTVTGPLIDATHRDSGAGTMYACCAGEWYRIGLD